MPYCLAPNCKNRSFAKSKNQCEIDVENKTTFHLFPKNIERQRIWLDRMGLMEDSMPKYAYLCSSHFSPQSFDRTSAFKVRLKDDAIPNVFRNGSRLDWGCSTKEFALHNRNHFLQAR